MPKYFTTHTAEKGVTVIVLDLEGEKVNKLSSELGTQLGPILEQLSIDSSCTGIVIISGKPDNFVAGADIEQLARMQSAAEAEALSREGQRMLDRLAAMKVPVVAAIHGACLGGGLELAMACHSRVCSDAPETKLGQPEIQLGLIPGAGGTQRLPRLVGVQAALDMILTGKNIRPKKALKMGLVDELVPKPLLERAAVERVLVLAKEHHARKKSAVVDLGEIKKWAGEVDLTDMLLAHNPLGRLVVFRKSHDMVRSKTRGHYPAPFAALRAVEAGLAKGMEHGLKVEAEEFGRLVVSDVSRRLVEIFFATQALKKDTGVASKDVKPRTVSRLAVLGGGLMGAGIAFVSVEKGVDVRIKEVDVDACGRGMASVGELVQGRVKRKAVTAREAEVMMSRASATPDLTGFRRTDLIIEAVFEDLQLKQDLLRKFEDLVDEKCIFASNTSSLPIKQIASASKRPENVLGMHFFSPVHKMPLLEIIVHPTTSDAATVTAVEFGKKLGKQVIVVRDGVGFYTSRILAPYLNEAARVLAEGAAIEEIDRAMMELGFPVGPITLMDEVGIDVGAKVAKIMYQAYGERMHPEEALAAVIGDNRLGRKNKRGFYTYEDKKKHPDETVYDLLPGGRKRKPINAQEVQRRIALQMVNEALLCLGEGILRKPLDGDIGAIFGLGFPPFLGGPFRYVDVRGAERVLSEMMELRQKLGPRFEPAPALVDAARNRHKFRD